MLLLKLLLVPAFLAAISFAGKRWGPGVAGWLVGFPAVTGPVLLILALERGDAFTAQAAVLSLSAGISAMVFAVSYAWACTRLHWPGALACAFSAWFATLPMLAQLPVSAVLSLALCVTALVVAPRLFPRPRGPLHSRRLPAHELLLRMAAGAAMVFTVTAAAESLGPAWTGFFAAFPIMTSLITAFSHRANGPAFAILLLRAMAGGFYSYVAYCFSVAVLLEAWGFGATFAAAVAAAVVVQGAAKALMMRSERKGYSG